MGRVARVSSARTVVASLPAIPMEEAGTKRFYDALSFAELCQPFWTAISNVVERREFYRLPAGVESWVMCIDNADWVWLLPAKLVRIDVCVVCACEANERFESGAPCLSKHVLDAVVCFSLYAWLWYRSGGVCFEGMC